MLLTGDRPRRCGGSGSRAIIKFGLRLAAECNFLLTNDPAARSVSNIALLAEGIRHDVHWLIDSNVEFGRYVHP